MTGVGKTVLTLLLCSKYSFLLQIMIWHGSNRDLERWHGGTALPLQHQIIDKSLFKPKKSCKYPFFYWQHY